MAEKAKTTTCRGCGKKRKLDEDGLCGKCQADAGGGEEESCDVPTAEALAMIEAALEKDTSEGEEEKAPAEVTMFGPALGEPEIPKNIAVRFRKKLDKDPYTPGVPELIGVATTPEAKEKLMAKANNGRRILRLEVRETKGSTYFGVYAS